MMCEDCESSRNVTAVCAQASPTSTLKGGSRTSCVLEKSVCQAMCIESIKKYF